MSSPNVNASLNTVTVPIPTPTSIRTTTINPTTSSDMSSSDDSEDEGDELVYRFRVVNPDMPSDNKQHDTKNSTTSTTKNRIDSTLETASTSTSLPSLRNDTIQAMQHPTISTNIQQNNNQTLASPVQDHETKALPVIPPSDTSTHLKRRQSKTLGTEEITNQLQPSSPTRIYTISEIVEYQPHHSRASILEPLSMTVNNNQQQQQQHQQVSIAVHNPSMKSEPPKLMIPPAPSFPPPPPPTPAKDKTRCSIMTISPNNNNNTNSINNTIEGEGTQSTDQLEQHTASSSNETDNNSQSIVNGNTQRHSAPFTIRNNNTSTIIHPTDHVSKYHHASYSLTNNPDAIKLYREMAEKTQDDMTQLTYAKYLLEVAELYNQPSMMVEVSSAAGGNRDDDDTKQQLETDLRKKKKVLEQEGIRWIRRLSKKGVGEAAFLEATWLETEQYGYKTRHAYRIERLYQMAIQAGVPEASYRLALRKESTNTQPYSDIFRLYQKAADLHCVAAIYKMAKIYLHGQLDQEQNFKNGMKYLLSAVQHATITCNEPPYTLALILSNKYTKVSIPSELIETYGGVTKVREYMETSSNLGNIGAKNRLGHLWEQGTYGPMNMAQAFMNYEEAAKQGHHLQSMLGLSRLYNQGCHGPNDQDEHYRLENDTSGWLAAHPRDEDQSFYWCQRSAKGGLPDALYLLGWYYEIGFGTSRNDQLSVEYYQQASRKGHLDAKDRLVTRQKN